MYWTSDEANTILHKCILTAKWEFPKWLTCLHFSWKLNANKCKLMWPCHRYFLLGIFAFSLLHQWWIDRSLFYDKHSSQKISNVYFLSKIHSIGNLNWVISDWIQKSGQIQGWMKLMVFHVCNNTNIKFILYSWNKAAKW